MFENVDTKIQGFAKILCWLLIICYIIIGIYLWVLGSDMYDGGYMIGFGIGVLIAGPLTAWAGSLVMYGFGMLVEKYCESTSCVNPNRKTTDEDDELPEL